MIYFKHFLDFVQLVFKRSMIRKIYFLYTNTAIFVLNLSDIQNRNLGSILISNQGPINLYIFEPVDI